MSPSSCRPGTLCGTTYAERLDAWWDKMAPATFGPEAVQDIFHMEEFKAKDAISELLDI